MSSQRHLLHDSRNCKIFILNYNIKAKPLKACIEANLFIEYSF